MTEEVEVKGTKLEHLRAQADADVDAIAAKILDHENQILVLEEERVQFIEVQAKLK